jgi:AraC-like DNA-binding protein
MKVIPFTIPVPSGSSVHIQHEKLAHFYEHLHQHREVQITLILKGTGSLLASNQLHPFGSGDLFMIGANVPHVFKSDPTYFKNVHSDAVEAWTIFFDPSGAMLPLFSLPEMLAIRKWLSKFAGGIKWKKQATKIHLPLLEHVMHSNGADRLAALVTMLRKLSLSKHFISLTQMPANLNETEGQRMNAIMQYSTRHFAETITIEDVARIAHMTPQAFCRYFKKHTRKTYINFLNEIRVHESCRLLQDKGMGNMAAIAWECGFNNVPNFNRVFRKVLQCTPGEFLQSQS